jgi:hypothetical protein
LLAFRVTEGFEQPYPRLFGCSKDAVLENPS